MTAQDVRSEIVALLEGLEGIESVDSRCTRTIPNWPDHPDHPSTLTVYLTNGVVLKVHVSTDSK